MSIKHIPFLFIFIDMAEQSHFSTQPKRLLGRISKELIDKGFDASDPYDDYYDNFKIMEKVFRFFGYEAVDEDYQFFCKFIKDNDDLLSEIFETKDASLYDGLSIPIAQEYKIKYTIDGSCSFTEFYSDTVSCYDEDWVESMLYNSNSKGTWDFYEGNLYNTAYDNYETSDFSINEVKPAVTESKSLLSRLVIENTSDVVSSLDKETLYELKRIIDSRLSSL